MISEDEELHYLLKLHSTIQKVKVSNNENTTAISGLKNLFTDLGDHITRVQKMQSKAAPTT